MFRTGMKCFFEEARALARLEHPNVVRVRDFFRANDTVYLVMRYERGRTLHDHIQQRARRARGALGAQHLRPAARRAARGAHEQAAAPRHQAGQRLPAQRRHAAADRLRRRAPDAVGRGHEAAADLHAGLRAARACTLQARAARARGATSTRWARRMYACFAGAAPQPANARLEKDRCVPASKAFAGKYAAELLEIVDWCLRARSPAAPAERARPAEGSCSESKRSSERMRPALPGAASARARCNEDRVGHWTAPERGADGGRRRPGRPPARRARGADRDRDPGRRVRGARRTTGSTIPRTSSTRAFAAAHAAIVREADERALPETPRTVIVACVVQDGHAFWTHVGDCRFYLLREGAHRTRARATTPWCSGWSTRGASARRRRPRIRTATGCCSCLGGVSCRRASSRRASVRARDGRHRAAVLGRLLGAAHAAADDPSRCSRGRSPRRSPSSPRWPRSAPAPESRQHFRGGDDLARGVPSVRAKRQAPRRAAPGAHPARASRATPKARCWSSSATRACCAPRASRSACRRSSRAAGAAGSPPSTACCRARPTRAPTARRRAASSRAARRRSSA